MLWRFDIHAILGHVKESSEKKVIQYETKHAHLKSITGIPLLTPLFSKIHHFALNECHMRNKIKVVIPKHNEIHHTKYNAFPLIALPQKDNL